MTLQAIREPHTDPVAGDITATLPETTGDLIEHILERYHETHRRELSELARLARRVETMHGAHPKAPRGLADILTVMIGELEVHMKKEELILFPMMRKGGHPGIGDPLAMMRHDHDDHEAHLRRLESITDGFRLPEGACRSWQTLYAGAMAHVTQCPYCIQSHTKGAKRAGASPEQIMEAIWVAAEMRAGAAFAHSAIALETLEDDEGTP